MNLNNIPPLGLEEIPLHCAQFDLLNELLARIIVMHDNIINLSNVLGKPIDEQENVKAISREYEEIRTHIFSKYGK